MANMNPNASYGRALLDSVGSVVPTFGNIHVVYSASDASTDRVDSLRNVFKPFAGKVRLWDSVEDAIDAATTNNNDVIALDAASTHAISTGITLTKNRIHFIGLDGGGRLVQQGARISLSGAVDSAFVLKNTGVRNTFRNIKFIQSSTHANALTVAQFGGEGNLYENCSFTFGVADNLDQATAYEVVNGEDSGTFIDCQFGVDTLLTSAARRVMLIDQVTSGQEFKSNRFRGCNFLVSSSDADAQFINMAAAGDILFTNLFEDCTFVASVDSAGGAALTRAVASANGTVKGTLLFANPVAFNCTNFGTNGTNNDGIQAYGAVSTGTDLVGIAPTAT